MGKFRDLKGQKFGRLTVIELAEPKTSPCGNKVTMWLCQCECKKYKAIAANSLIKGVTRSCGCYSGEVTAKRKKRSNDYEIQADYVILYTNKNDVFYVDLEDFWKVKPICWYKNKDDYICGHKGGKTIYLHRLIMNDPIGARVDHIHGNQTKHDNRKANLRIVSVSQNAINSKMRKDNTSGCKGVTWLSDYKKWRARITINQNCIILGYFDTKEDAIKARLDAEKKYFQEFSYNESQIATWD